MFLYSRYLVYLNGLEAIQCPQNFGSFLHSFPCIQVYTISTYCFYLNQSSLLKVVTTKFYRFFFFFFFFLKFHNKTFNIQNAYFTYGLPIALPLKCSQNVVLLSDGVHAHVILIWEKVCGPNHTSHSSIEGGTLQ